MRSITVSCKLNALNDGIAELKFCVKDTGLGIAREDQKNLFQVFSQVDNSNTRKYQGTGLGLSIVKRIVNKLSGQVGLESELGLGSTFSFTLPQMRPME